MDGTECVNERRAIDYNGNPHNECQYRYVLINPCFDHLLTTLVPSAGIIGAQLFQEDDGPLYTKGWTHIVLIVLVGVGAIIMANAQYRILNRRLTLRGSQKRFAI
jgi:hypothetical protein